MHICKILPVAASTVLMFSWTIPTLAQGAVAKLSTIGTVDRDKVVTTYPKAQQAAEEMKRSEDKIHKLIEDSNKQYEEAKAAKKPPAELEGLQKRLQNQIDGEVQKIQSRAQTLETQLETDIDGAIKTEAANQKVDMVFLKQAVLLGGVDLTSGVMKRLSTAHTSASSSTTTTTKSTATATTSTKK